MFVSTVILICKSRWALPLILLSVADDRLNRRQSVLCACWEIRLVSCFIDSERLSDFCGSKTFQQFFTVQCNATWRRRPSIKSPESPCVRLCERPTFLKLSSFHLLFPFPFPFPFSFLFSFHLRFPLPFPLPPFLFPYPSPFPLFPSLFHFSSPSVYFPFLFSFPFPFLSPSSFSFPFFPFLLPLFLFLLSSFFPCPRPCVQYLRRHISVTVPDGLMVTMDHR